MIIDETTKEKIRKEYECWLQQQYAGKTKEERKKFAQYFTPPSITIRLLEKFDSLEGNILDPTSGCGGLLAAAVIAGADPCRVYGLELDADIVKISQERLSRLGVPATNIRVGDALQASSYNF